VLAGPATQLLQNSHLLLADAPVRPRSDIQQQVAAHADAVDQDPDDLVGGLVVDVVGLIAPGVVHGQAEFPVRIERRGDGNTLLRRGIVAITLQA
jgi:hypothetical protein